MQLSDVRLLVDRFDECVAFYRDVMGLRRRPRRAIALPWSSRSRISTRRAGQLEERGAELVTEGHDQQAWGVRVAHLRDPDGNLIELNQPLG